MLAKCSRCSQTFQTDRYGEQFCPFCGAAVMIAQPPGTAPTLPSGAPPPGGQPPPGATGPQDQPAPIDVPAQFGGWLTAAVETWKKAIMDPSGFFNRVTPGPDTGGAIGYAMVLLGVGGIFAGAMQYLQGLVQRGQFEQMQRQMAEMPPELHKFMGVLMRFAEPKPSMIILAPVMAIVGFFISAALMHLAMMIVGGNKNGFTATVRALAFAQSPYIFNVIPICGGMAAGIWTLVLTVMALSGLHRVSIGRAIGAYAVLVVGMCCLCIVPVGGVVGYLASQAAHHGPAAFDVP